MRKVAPNGVNLLTTYIDYDDSDYEVAPASSKPKDSEISKYFFLPALGFYHNGMLNYFGSDGTYWSSSARPGFRNYACALCFNSGDVYMNAYVRINGFVAQPLE